MNRSLLIGISGTLLLFTAIAIYFYFFNIKQKTTEITDAVPNDAVFIFESSNMVESWKTLEGTDLWKDLKQNTEATQTFKDIEKIQSIIAGDNQIKDLLMDNASVLSLHATSTGLGILGIVDGNLDETELGFIDYLRISTGTKSIKRYFEKLPIYEFIKPTGETLFAIGYQQKALLITNKSNLIEESYRRVVYQIPSVTKGFKQVKLLAKAGNDANLFINYHQLNNLMNQYLKTEHQQLFSFFSGFANWGFLEVGINTSNISLQGASYTDDSVFQFLDLFRNQAPKPLTLHKVMPKNTAFCLQMGFTDYPRFNTDLNEYLQLHKKFESYQQFNDSINTRYNINLISQVIPLIDGEAALMMTEPAAGENIQKMAAYIRFKNPVGMNTFLHQTVDLMKRKGELDSAQFEHQGKEILHIKLNNFLKLYYGQVMEQIVNPYVVQLDDFFVFANDLTNLKFLIDDYYAKNILGSDATFISYEEEIASSQNINITLFPNKLTQMPAGYVNDQVFSWINLNQPYLKKLSYFTIQYAASGNKSFYTQVYFKYQASTSGASQQIWNYKLDTTVAIKPQVLPQRSTGQQIIFVQDIKNTLYCLTQQGALLWRSKLTGKVLGDFIHLEEKTGTKSRYFFSTDKQAFIIDEAGVSAQGFPIQYPGKAIGAPLVNYTVGDTLSTFYVNLENFRAVGYYTNGKSIKGWMPKHWPFKPLTGIQSFIAGSRKLYYCTSTSGKLMMSDEQGKTVNIKQQTIAYQFMATQDKLSDTTTFVFQAIDSSSQLIEIKFDSLFKQTSVLSKGISGILQWEYIKDIATEKRYYLFKQLAGTTLLDNDLRPVSNFESKDTNTYAPLLLKDFSGRIILGVVQPAKEAYSIYSNNGKLHPDCPISGYSVFTVSGFYNDGKNYILGGDNRNNIFLYKLK
ncbi:MAG: hypothetical protein MUC81_09725 [Bacteroidia bacterium]|nr:hypothetical protein [Bacteroidia bacterium]